MNTPKSISNLPAKYQDAILELSDERNNGDGWWIYLKEPFFNPDMESNIIHEQKLSDCIAQLKLCVNNPITKDEYFERQKLRAGTQRSPFGIGS